MLQGINFIKTFLNNKEILILKNLEDIPLFNMNSGFVRVNNYLVIVYIAHMLGLELEKIFEFHCAKFFLKSILYGKKTFVCISCLNGAQELLVIWPQNTFWTAFISSKGEFLKYESE